MNGRVGYGGDPAMAIFARRTIQRLLVKNSSFLTREQVIRHVNSLNSRQPYALADEWEVVVLNAFSRLGWVEHEPDFGGPRKPDVYFGAGSDRGRRPRFVADITTVTNKVRNEANPIRAFDADLVRRIRKAGLDPDKFSLRVEGAVEVAGKRKVTKLRLPPIGAIRGAFDASFDEYLLKCKREPADSRQFSKTETGVNFAIGYNPNQPYHHIGYPSFEVAHTLAHNPIHSSLEEKYDQLSETNSPVPSGIILCEVDCSLRNSLSGFTPHQIIDDFLRQHTSIAFVLALAAVVDPPRSTLAPTATPRVYSRLYRNPAARDPISDSDAATLEALVQQMPQPINGGHNALNAVRLAPRSSRSFAGGFTVTDNTLRISARSLLELLAGAQAPTAKVSQLVAGMLKRGRTIDGLAIEPNPDLDDDWITIHFRDRDAAIATFRAPGSEGKSDGPNRGADQT
jgi:hypothetical protein